MDGIIRPAVFMYVRKRFIDQLEFEWGIELIRCNTAIITIAKFKNQSAGQI